MDGTMVESEMLHYHAYKEILSTLGAQLSLEDYFHAWGSDKDMCMRFVEKFHLSVSLEELLNRKNKTFREVYLQKVTPQPGLMDLLKKLRQENYSLAVCSSAQMHDIEIVLNTISAKKFFDQIVSAESVEHGKPAPDCYLLTAEKLGVNPSDCLVIEDAPKGVAAAKAADMKCFVIPSIGLEKADFTGADRVLENLSQVPNYLQGLTS